MAEAKIFLIDPQKKALIPMPEATFVAEAQLQSYLADYPDLLPGDQIDPDAPRRWLLVARELGIPKEIGGGNWWSLDHLFLDQDGIPTFVECKRASDNRSRREVVAQMLDYAANGPAYWKPEWLRQAAAESATTQGISLDDLVLQLLRSENTEDVDAFWERVNTNLREGHIRLLFVLDHATKELPRLVEFLNAKMADVEVMIVEIKHFQGAGQTALVSRILGETETGRTTKSTSKQQPLQQQEFLSQCHPAAAELFSKTLETAKARGYKIRWNPKCFVIRVSHPHKAQDVSLLYGWCGTDNFSVDFSELRKGFDFSMEEETKWRQELLKPGVFKAKGISTLDGSTIELHNRDAIDDYCHRIYDLIDQYVQAMR